MVIAPELKIRNAAALHSSFAAELESGTGPLRVDLGGVEAIDAAGIQLLVSAQSAAEAAGRRFELQAASEVVDRALTLVGLADRFGRPARY